MTGPGVEAAPSGTDFWGTSASDIQSGVSISGNTVNGTLKYRSSGQIVTDWGAGYFIGIKLTAEDWEDYTSVKVGIVPTQGTGLVEILTDPDKIALLKVTSLDQRIEILATDGTNTSRQFYDLSGITLQGAGT